MQVLAIIPARYGSRRFPGKALHPVEGRPLIARVARAAVAAGVADQVIVATDDARIAEAVAGEDVEVVTSDEPFGCGSDRVAAAARGRALDPSRDVVINVQGDEALVSREVLLASLAALEGGAEIGTVASPLGEGLLDDQDVVKVAFEPARGEALAFGRGRASFERLAGHGLRADDGRADALRLWAHVGIYAFRPGALERFASLPPSENERRERLEQLRAMDAGMSIGVRVVEAACLAINRPDDVALVEAQLRGARPRAAETASQKKAAEAASQKKPAEAASQKTDSPD